MHRRVNSMAYSEWVVCAHVSRRLESGPAWQRYHSLEASPHRKPPAGTTAAEFARAASSRAVPHAPTASSPRPLRLAVGMRQCRARPSAYRTRRSSGRRFMLVRNPYSRLLSAYLDKVVLQKVAAL